MGRKPLPIDQIRAEMKFGAPRRVLEALSKEADEEGITRKKLAEKIVTAHVEKREKKLGRPAAKTDKAAPCATRKSAKPQRRRGRTA